MVESIDIKKSSYNVLSWKTILITLVFIAIVVIVIYMIYMLTNTRTYYENYTGIPLSVTSTITNIPNVITFSSDGWKDSKGNGGNDIQSKVDEIYNLQSENEFGEDRYALLFKPGTYNANIRVGYYTTVIGLGESKSDVVINGNVQSLPQGSAPSPGFLDRFWRSCENLTVIPNNNNLMLWGVSQASHLRSVHVKGNLYLAMRPGYASGGFMSDCLVDKGLRFQTQQQFFTRNAQFQDVGEGSWNFVLVGNEGTILENQQCNKPGVLYSVEDTTPIIAAKPYLVFKSDTYQIKKPNVQFNVKGLLSDDGIIISPSQIYVATPTKNAAYDINTAISDGKHILLTPGIYQIEEPIRVSRSGTVILGLGLATLQPMKGTSALIVEDNAVGVRLSSFMVQASRNGGSYLIEIGTTPNVVGDINNPTILSDVFCRVGGVNSTENVATENVATENVATENVDTMIVIRQQQTILDGVWLWRADHTSQKHQGLGVDKAICNHCLVVNADNVTTYGLHVEHALQELILWNGNKGKIYFIQSELAYDVPANWDYPALRIADDVTDFYGVGLGFYSFFSKSTHPDGKFPNVTSAIVTPEAKGIVINSAFTIFLSKASGGGSIQHVINNRGSYSDVSNADIPVRCSLNTEDSCSC